MNLHVFLFRMTSSFSIYNARYVFRGRHIDENSEPPYNFTERFMDHLTQGFIHERNDVLNPHSCSSNCSIESCIVMGRPYTGSVLEAVDW